MSMNRRAFLRQVGGGAAGVGALSLAGGCRTFIANRGGDSLPRGTPEAEGIASAGIESFLDAAAGGNHELHSFMLARHGRVVAEGWWSPYGPRFNHTLYSLSKSFTSTAVGFAVAEGRLSVGDKVLPFFPESRPPRVSEHLAALRVKDLLSMAVGNGKEPTWDMVKEDDWVRAFLAAPVDHPPGTRFMYNSGATYMCSAIVQRVSGQKIIDYLRPRLFDPLGLRDTTWETCPRGINTGGWGLSVPTEGLARFGQLYLQKGMWRGQPILPARWIEEATTFKIQQPLPDKPGRPNERNDWVQGYGYQFWRCRHHAFRGDGAFGQFMVVMPEQDAVVAITAECRDLQAELDLVWDHLLPAMKTQPLPADRSAHARLRQRLAALALALPAGRPPPHDVAGRVSGRTFRLQPNDLGLDTASFAFSGDTGRMTLAGGGRDHPLAFGVGRWVRGETALPGTPPRLISGGAPRPGTLSKVAAAAAWKDERTVELTLRYYETPHRDTVTCRFDAAGVQIAFLNSIAGMSPNPKDPRPILRGEA